MGKSTISIASFKFANSKRLPGRVIQPINKHPAFQQTRAPHRHGLRGEDVIWELQFQVAEGHLKPSGETALVERSSRKKSEERELPWWIGVIPYIYIYIYCWLAARFRHQPTYVFVEAAQVLLSRVCNMLYNQQVPNLLAGTFSHEGKFCGNLDGWWKEKKTSRP